MTITGERLRVSSATARTTPAAGARSMIPKKYQSMVNLIEKVDGMCTPNGVGWEAVLKDGFCYDGTHTITADTKRDLFRMLNDIEPCACEGCKYTAS